MPDFATFGAGQGRQTARHRSSRNLFAKQSFQAQSLQDMVQLVFQEVRLHDSQFFNCIQEIIIFQVLHIQET